MTRLVKKELEKNAYLVLGFSDKHCSNKHCVKCNWIALKWKIELHIIPFKPVSFGGKKSIIKIIENRLIRILYFFTVQMNWIDVWFEKSGLFYANWTGLHPTTMMHSIWNRMKYLSVNELATV